MLALRFVWVGRSAESEYEQAIGRYEARLSRWAKIERVPIRAEKERSAQAARREALRILPAIAGRQKVVALDERGRSMGSEDLAKFLAGHRDRDPRPLAFVVGGASGLADEVLEKSDLRLSLSRMTLPHSLARLVLVEQLYRGLAIDAGLRYH